MDFWTKALIVLSALTVVSLWPLILLTTVKQMAFFVDRASEAKNENVEKEPGNVIMFLTEEEMEAVKNARNS